MLGFLESPKKPESEDFEEKKNNEIGCHNPFCDCLDFCKRKNNQLFPNNTKNTL